MDGNILHGSYDVHENEDSSSDCESTTSTVRLDRKKRKPLMEKKRRARINASLEQLKKLVLDAMKKDSARYSKLEKADILELTVRHLREGQQQSMNVAIAQDVSVAPKFKAGFAECASEVGRYLSSIDGLNHNVSARLMQHLSHYVQRIEHCTLTTASNATTTTTSSKMYHHHHNNNQYHHRVQQQQQQQQQQQGGYRSSTVNPSNIRVVSEANLHQPHTNPHPMYNPSTGKSGSAVSCSVQPLQIHIPSAAPSLLLPGFRSSISEHLSGSGSGSVMRTSPEPGNLPPTPPSSAENSFNGNFNFIPVSVSVSESLQAQYPYNVHNRRDFAPLKAKENIAALSNNISKQKQLHSVINNNHVKFSPASVRGNIKNEIKQSVKQEDMWRPW